jgi:hypothetical protein
MRPEIIHQTHTHVSIHHGTHDNEENHGAAPIFQHSKQFHNQQKVLIFQLRKYFMKFSAQLDQLELMSVFHSDNRRSSVFRQFAPQWCQVVAFFEHFRLS